MNTIATTTTIVSEASDNEDSVPLIKVSRRKQVQNVKATTSRRRPPPKHCKHYVEHNYHDHSHDLLSDSATDDDNEHHKSGRPCNRGGVSIPFPEKLHYMLDQMDMEGTKHIVNWQPHGRCFVVHKPKEFVEQIMPR